jgi:hypothetical protein
MVASGAFSQSRIVDEIWPALTRSSTALASSMSSWTLLMSFCWSTCSAKDKCETISSMSASSFRSVLSLKGYASWRLAVRTAARMLSPEASLNFSILVWSSWIFSSQYSIGLTQHIELGPSIPYAKISPKGQPPICDPCKLRRQKCKGVRPSCHDCQLPSLFRVLNSIAGTLIRQDVSSWCIPRSAANS